MSKTLVLFYSYEGSTRRIAHFIADNVRADLEEIKPVKEIKSKRGTYVWGGSQVVMKTRPKLKPLKVDLDEYETIILGTPVWAFTFAPPIRSLLQGGYLKNKNIGFYYCHEGGADKMEKRAKAAIEKENTFLSAFSCLNVVNDFDNVKEKALQWAKEIN